MNTNFKDYKYMNQYKSDDGNADRNGDGLTITLKVYCG